MPTIAFHLVRLHRGLQNPTSPLDSSVSATYLAPRSTIACSASHVPARRRFVVALASAQEPLGQGSVGVVIVDHGSRKKDSNEQLVEFGSLYQQMTGAKLVEVAHMEIAQPTIEQAIGKCAAAGATTVVVAPYFLSRGRHIQEDIPALVSEAQAKYGGIHCIIADPIGVDPLMAQLINNRVQKALQQTKASVAASG